MDMQIDITYARSLKEMASLLRYLISIYGTELYKDKQRLYNLIADLYTGEERLKRLFRRAILEDNLSQRVYELIHKKIGERKALVDKIACLFAENNFISYEVGEKVVLDFVKGLNLLLENPLRLREDGKWEDEQGNVYSEDRLTFEKANRGVSEIIVKEGTEEIGKEACRDCTSLISIALPSSLTKIGYSAFEGCSSLSSIIIPEHVTKISYSAFENCISLSSIMMSSHVTEIAAFVLSGCISLSSIMLPDGITNIGYYAFSDCISLSSVVLPDSITDIGDYAFSGCISLFSITIPVHLEGVGIGAFMGCISLKQIIASEELLKNLEFAFEGYEHFL